MLVAIEPPAFYGKLPGHGDFVGRGLASAQKAQIDQWLAGWMAAARAKWGEGFDELYRDAQPWLYEGNRLSAVAIPSADRIGRLFPLLAIAKAGVDLQALYDAVVSAIGESWAGDRLKAVLGNLDATHTAKFARGWFVPDEDRPMMPHPLVGAGGDTIGAMIA